MQKYRSTCPQGVTATIAADAVTIKGAKGSLSAAARARACRWCRASKKLRDRRSPTPTTRAQPTPGAAPCARTSPTWCTGVTKGFEKKLELVGVGYRAAVQGKNLNLTLGFSHPVNCRRSRRASRIETPSQTEIMIKGIDRQQVGQVAAEIRDIRPPEPYKGKGVRYADEKITLKEGKKK